MTIKFRIITDNVKSAICDKCGNKVQHFFTRYFLGPQFRSDKKEQLPKERDHMRKIDLIKTLSTTTNITKIEASKIINLFFDQMASALEKGDRVEVRGLCSFYVKDYPGYTGRNPKTGKTVKVAPKKLPYFKCGKELRERVDR